MDLSGYPWMSNRHHGDFLPSKESAKLCFGAVGDDSSFVNCPQKGPLCPARPGVDRDNRERRLASPDRFSRFFSEGEQSGPTRTQEEPTDAKVRRLDNLLGQ